MNQNAAATTTTGGDDDGPWSVLEMGGASVQFTMPMTETESTTVPDDYKLSYHLAPQQQSQSTTTTTKGEVFTHSFLGLGMESARKAVNEALVANGATEDPCLPTNYVEEHDVNEFSGATGMTPGTFIIRLVYRQ